MGPTILCFGETLWDMLPGKAKPDGVPVDVVIHLNRLRLDPVFISLVGSHHSQEIWHLKRGSDLLAPLELGLPPMPMSPLYIPLIN